MEQNKEILILFKHYPTRVAEGSSFTAANENDLYFPDTPTKESYHVFNHQNDQLKFKKLLKFKFCSFK